MSEVRVKRYRSARAADRDARRMARAGWSPQGTAGGSTRLSLTRNAVKVSAIPFLGPLALLFPSRKSERVTVTWVRE